MRGSHLGLNQEQTYSQQGKWHWRKVLVLVLVFGFVFLELIFDLMLVLLLVGHTSDRRQQQKVLSQNRR